MNEVTHYFYVFIFLVSFVALGVSSGVCARSFLKLSRVLWVNEYILSFILIGVITSLPELFVAIASIIINVPLISVGNIIGANFITMTLVLGIVSVLSNGVELSPQISKRVFWLSFLLALLPIVLIFKGGISRIDGLILCAIFIVYLVVFSHDVKFLERSIPYLPYGADYLSDAYSSLINLLVGLPILVLSSLFIVFFGTSLVGFSPTNLIFFGTVFLGLLTTLPELFFGIRGAILNCQSLALNNVLASVVFNGTVIIGLISVISPITIRLSTSSFLLEIVFMFVAFLLLSVFSYTGSRISRLEGILLMSVYFLFLVSVLFV